MAGSLGLALLAGCDVVPPGAAVATTPRVAVGDPQASYNAARIAEGAYLASGRADPATLVQLLERDRAARQALAQMHANPSEGGAQAREAVGRLADLLISQAEF